MAADESTNVFTNQTENNKEIFLKYVFYVCKMN